MQQDFFSQYQQIAGLINQGDDVKARTEVITLLQKFKDNNLSEYPPVLNALIKAVGLYPYMHSDTSDWSDRLAYEAYKIDVVFIQNVRNKQFLNSIEKESIKL